MSGKRALLIGINYAKTTHELNGCINDVLAVTALLTPLGWTCTQMVDTLPRDSPLYPSSDKIQHQMRELVRLANAGDQLFLHYSGHGTHTYDKSGDEEDGRDEALYPAEGPLITDDMLRALLVDRVPATARLTMLLDCCHSGTGADLHYNYEDTSTFTSGSSGGRRIPDEYAPKQWTSHYSRRVNERCQETPQLVVCISGCRDRQTSADTVFDGKYSGAMTAAFVRAWKAHGGDSGRANIREVLKYMTCMLKCYRYTQVPQLSMSARQSDMLYALDQCYLEL